MVRLSHEDSGSSGRFVIYDDDIFAGEMTYTRRNDGNIVIDHTGVESAFGGKGYGGLLQDSTCMFVRGSSFRQRPHYRRPRSLMVTPEIKIYCVAGQTFRSCRRQNRLCRKLSFGGVCF